MLKLLRGAVGCLGLSPTIRHKVKGFKLTAEKKEGVLLKTKDDKPTTEDSYYELSVEVTGKNKHYPTAKDKCVVGYVTTAKTQADGHGIYDNIHFLSKGARIVGFEIAERYVDPHKENWMGHRPPPHHCVYVHIVYRQGASLKKSRQSFSCWMREDEIEMVRKGTNRTMWI